MRTDEGEVVHLQCPGILCVWPQKPVWEPELVAVCAHVPPPRRAPLGSAGSAKTQWRPWVSSRLGFLASEYEEPRWPHPRRWPPPGACCGQGVCATASCVPSCVPSWPVLTCCARAVRLARRQAVGHVVARLECPKPEGPAWGGVVRTGPGCPKGGGGRAGGVHPQLGGLSPLASLDVVEACA